MPRQTKSDLERVISDMRAAQSVEDRLIDAVTTLIASPSARNVKHMFYRRDAQTMQISLDMHEEY